MKSMKKILPFLLCICIMLSVSCLSVFATEYEPSYAPHDINSLTSSSYSVLINGIYYSVPANIIVGYNHTTTGNYVKIAQMALNRINSLYSTANCSCGSEDSIFGPDTWQGVYNFQVWTNLSDQDGIVGPDTWTRISWYSY